ncbi:hypothetical protein, partial [Novosphingobium sp. NDB2Meth1]|uniref:hypothetical protein n=1 Tax=Novosphingobium sp. NDB2Meth1 TaxID=1892847 RepID=UPI001C0D0DF0
GPFCRRSSSSSPGSSSHPNPTRRSTVATLSEKPSYTTPWDTTPITPRAVADWLDKIKANDPIYRMAMQAFAERGPVDLSRGAMEKIARDILSSGAKTYD